jgi:hypothetical protein
VLHQGNGSVVFFSKPIVPQHAKLTEYEQELIGLIQAVKHWSPYLWGTPYFSRTNHISLKFLLDQKLSRIPQHRWVSKLLRFDFWVEYKSGISNVMVGALSHCDTDESPQLSALSAPTFALLDQL